jgi:transposase
MVLGMIRCKSERDNRFMSQYRYLKKNKGSGKALVAMARKFTKMIWTMLTNDEDYNYDKASAYYKVIKNAEALERGEAA